MEPDNTITCLAKAADGMRNDIAYQIARVVDGALVSIVRPPDWSYETIENLNRMIYQMRDTDSTTPGCAIGVVPDGHDVWVAVTGMSVEACTVAAEHLAAKAARIFTSESLA